ACFEAHLMNSVVAALQEKVFVKRDAAVATGVKFDHPTANPIGIKLFIPCCIKRVGEIDPIAVAAYFHHLRTAGQRLVWLFRMRRAIHNSAYTQRSEEHTSELQSP